MGGLDKAQAPEGTTYVTRALDGSVPEDQAAQSAAWPQPEPKPAQDARASAPAESVSFRDVFARYAPYVVGLVRRLGVREAEVEDVAQEVFIVVHRQLPSFEGRSSIKTWLCGISLRTVANHRRKVMRRRESNIEVSGELLAPPDQDALLERKDSANNLLRALDTLTPKLREVFVLYEIEELPMLDIARTLGCPRFTAYTRLHAARAALRQRLAEHEPSRSGTRKRGRS
jgi:RNA polymerase sigma-70 factor (ECF subfamily)